MGFAFPKHSCQAGFDSVSTPTKRVRFVSSQRENIESAQATATIDFTQGRYSSTRQVNRILTFSHPNPCGGIHNYGTLTITNSTISGNRASGVGGGLNNGGLFGPSGTLMISNSTISRNIAGEGESGGIFSDRNGTTAELQNSIVANNAGSDCHGTMTSDGYNLSSEDSCSFNATGDLENTDPNLGPLQDNGGPTQTMGLLPGSRAIDTGNPDGCTDDQGHLLKTDQRGAPRPDKEDSDGCDIGAYERQQH